MRWSLATPLAMLLAGAVLWSCESTPPECVDYCAAVADALRRCSLQQDFDQEDCVDRTVDGEPITCATTAALVGISACDDIAGAFCGDDTFPCPDLCASGCCSDIQCAEPQPHCNVGTATCQQCLTNEHCATQVCNSGGYCVQCTEETEADVCAAGEVCDYNYNCRLSCSEDEDCGPWRICSRSGLCSTPVGTPCPLADCGAGSCEYRDAADMQVDSYCTIPCDPSDAEPCPPGYTCNVYCRPD